MNNNSIHAAQKLKSLQSQLAKKESDLLLLKDGIKNLFLLKDEIKNKQRKCVILSNEVAALKNELTFLQKSSKTPIVSENSLLRYLERVKGLGIGGLKQEVLDATTVAQKVLFLFLFFYS